MGKIYTFWEKNMILSKLNVNIAAKQKVVLIIIPF